MVQGEQGTYEAMAMKMFKLKNLPSNLAPQANR
jgi:hypothetical protein